MFNTYKIASGLTYIHFTTFISYTGSFHYPSTLIYPCPLCTGELPWDKKSLVIWNLCVNPRTGIRGQVLMAWVPRHHPGTATGVALAGCSIASRIDAGIWIRGFPRGHAALFLWLGTSEPPLQLVSEVLLPAALPELCFVKTRHYSGEQAKTPRGRYLGGEGGDNPPPWGQARELGHSQV